jgi:hypothetical protein
MTNRISKWLKCDHFNWTPCIYISADIYIFYCADCNTLIMRDYKKLNFKKE